MFMGFLNGIKEVIESDPVVLFRQIALMITGMESYQSTTNAALNKALEVIMGDLHSQTAGLQALHDKVTALLNLMASMKAIMENNKTTIADLQKQVDDMKATGASDQAGIDANTEIINQMAQQIDAANPPEPAPAPAPAE